MTEYSEGAEVAAELAMESVGEGSTDGVNLSWHRSAAFATLVLAVLAAISALLAGVTSGEILIDRTEEIVDLSEALSDQVRVEVLEAKHQLLAAAGVGIPPEDIAEIEAIEVAEKELKEAQEAARDKAFAAESTHLVFGIAATIVAVSIAVTGLAVIANQRWLLAVGGLGGLIGLGILGIGLFEFV